MAGCRDEYSDDFKRVQVIKVQRGELERLVDKNSHLTASFIRTVLLDYVVAKKVNIESVTPMGFTKENN